MSGVNKFSGEGQAKLRFFSCIIGPLPKKKVAPVGKVTPSKDCKRGTNFLDNMDDTKFTKKPDLPVRNDSVTSKKRRNNRGIIWMIKKRLRLNNHQEIKNKK